MADKSWMLHPLTIRHARECIVIIKRDYGLILKLSDPDFLHLLQEKVALAGSRDLPKAYARLVTEAGIGDVMGSLHHEPAKPVVAALAAKR